MPVTFAHPVAVLALRRTPLPMSALVIGSMVPDLPLFLPWAPLDYATTHTPLGLVTVDVVIGVLVWAVWHAVIRAPVLDAAPSPLRRRIASAPAPRGMRALLVPVAVAVGATTHVVWDEFTHIGRWGERHITWLAEVHAGLPGVKWAQYVSGVGGLLLLAVVVAILLYRTPPAPQAPRARPRLAPWILAAPTGAVALTAAVVVATASEISLRSVAYGVITQGAVAGVAVLTLTCALWHVAPRR
ncbi:DUF4184 family protein [Mobilicoccus caccae]|uniref:DUF4184 family protein n=1 Tax=Mobilicoccus caccae TaxID=1859295 RepID=UPI0024E062B8|nr:DUF4184 family protein [Mobilicoccus caccae]